MTTTISVTTKRQVVLPKAFCDRKKIKPGSALRVTEIADGLYVTPIAEPNERELLEVIAQAGSLRRRQAAGEEELVSRVIADYRAKKRAGKE